MPGEVYLLIHFAILMLWVAAKLFVWWITKAKKPEKLRRLMFIFQTEKSTSGFWIERHNSDLPVKRDLNTE